MIRWKQGLSVAAAVALLCGTLPMGQPVVVRAEEQGNVTAVDATIKLLPSQASSFHDTDGDGLGEFEGWGTSLCWWANRLGYSTEMTEQAARVFFSDEGLDLNIGRYNVGGGDHVTDGSVGTDTIQRVPVNEKAAFYDLSTEGKKPTYAGSKMAVSTVDFSGATYDYSDADFGFTKGLASEKFEMIGWISGLDGTPGSGDVLNYTVSAAESGNYTVKLLLTLAGTNSRDVALRVNGTDYIASADTINDSEIATSGNQHLYVVTLSDVALESGDNTVLIGGSGTNWTVDFLKMAVIKSGEEGVVVDTETESDDPFLHASHIRRSDSVVPGYCVDVTKMNLAEHDLAYYQEHFARADVESGYAWNYNWDADLNQVNIMVAAAEASGEDFIAEAFSNSPPYFMTVSGCSSGNKDAGKDNLRKDCYTAFACYMADVIEHLNNADNGITFQSTTPMNEPYTNYWGAFSNKQEGCHFDQGESQSKIFVALDQELQKKGIDILISASDETSIDTAITSYKALSPEAKAVVDRIDTHTYSGSNRAGLNALAKSVDMNLWMSEVDGSYVGGTKAGEMGAAIGLGSQIITDVSGLESSAWILWNAVDMNVDANNQWDANSIEEMGFNPNGGYWGIAIGDHNEQNIVLTKKYYGYGQFSRYIRPGMTIIGSVGEQSLAAYDAKNHQVVIVAINGNDADETCKFGLTSFDQIGSNIKAIRTSGSLSGADAENWADVTDCDQIEVNTEGKFFTATLKANSITTYIMDGVTYDASKDDTKTMAEIAVMADMVTGSAPWNNNAANDATKTVDGNLSTFFDGLTDGFVQIDLGAAESLAAIAYAPRSGYQTRMKGGMFYGSNDGENWTLLYTVPSAPASGKLSYAFADQFLTKDTSFRYVKYTAAAGECANIAEIKLYTNDVYSIKTELPKVITSAEDLPKTLELQYVDKDEPVAMEVTWTGADELENYVGNKTITGTLANGKKINVNIAVVDKDMIYFFDCASTILGSSKEYYELAKEVVGEKLRNGATDQAYTAENGAGYTGGYKEDFSDLDQGDDIYSHGWWAYGDKNIEYAFQLEAGEYVSATGFQEWWNTNRATKITVAAGDTVLAEETFTLGANDTANLQKLAFTLEEDALVTVTVSKATNSDPVVSFFAIMQDAAYEKEVTQIKNNLGTWVSGSYSQNKAAEEENSKRIRLEGKLDVTAGNVYEAKVSDRDFRYIVRSKKDNKVTTFYLNDIDRFTAEEGVEYYLAIHNVNNNHKNLDFVEYVALEQSGFTFDLVDVTEVAKAEKTSLDATLSMGQKVVWESGTYSQSKATEEANQNRIRMTESLDVITGQSYEAVITQAGKGIKDFRFIIRDKDVNGKVTTFYLSNGDTFTAAEGHSYYVTTQNYYGNHTDWNFQDYYAAMSAENGLVFDLK